MKYLLISLIFVASCSTITNPDNELRVTEYGGKESYLGRIDGKIGGVRVVAKGTINGCLEYKGTKAKFTSKGCSK